MNPTEEALRNAQVENLMTDTRYKKILADAEPGKAMALAVGAGATATLALIGIMTAVFGAFKSLPIMQAIVVGLLAGAGVVILALILFLGIALISRFFFKGLAS